MAEAETPPQNASLDDAAPDSPSENRPIEFQGATAWRSRLKLPPLKPWRTLLPLLLIVIVLFVIGTPAGRVLAIALLPRLWVWQTPERPARAWVDALAALMAGLALALLVERVWGPRVIYGGTTASDIGEHFWMLHSLSNPGWWGWSINRYPLPALLARLVAFGADPHTCYARAAIVSMGWTGAGLFLWARAIAGFPAAVATLILVGVFPDLVLMGRTATAYPEMVALWTLAGGLVAYGVRFPGPITSLLAGVGTSLAFLSDSRGIVVGGLCFFAASLSALLAPSWRERGVRVILFSLPVALAFFLTHQLPIQVRSLEEMLEASIEVSYTRIGERPPERVFVEGGYHWGHSGPLEMARSMSAVLASRDRMNPRIGQHPEQRRAVEQRVFPYVLSILALAFFGLLMGGGFPGLRELRSSEAWWRFLDWRAKVGLLPVAGFLAIWINVISFEYNERYAALGSPALVLLAGVGLASLAGKRAPPWLLGALALSIVFVIPGPLNYKASWRTPFEPPRELTECLQRIEHPEDNRPMDDPVRRCVEAGRMRLEHPIAWPYQTPAPRAESDGQKLP